MGISVNADQVPNGVPVIVTATYEDPGAARALYATDDGSLRPDFSYMGGFLYPKPAHLPYLADRPVPTFPDAAFPAD